MAKRPQSPEPRLAKLEIAQIPLAITKLERRIADLRAAAPKDKDDLGAVVDSLCAKINGTLAEVFGPDTIEYRQAAAHQTNFIVIRMVVTPGRGVPWDERLREFEKGRTRVINAIQSQIDLLKERQADMALAPVEEAAPAPTPLSSTEIFIVHGQDNAAREEVARFLTNAGLKAIILHEQPNGGKTVIEKFENRTANIGFAVVLLTPDDEGGPAGGKMQPRARQNVIAELFYFMGKLGRGRVCALKKDDLEIPSDIAGLVYTPLDSGGGWRIALLRELEAAGYAVKWEAMR